jgi:hypothetical protein
MPRFDEALRRVAASLDLPQPDRSRILEEIAVDLEELRAELVRRGVPEEKAEARAVELLAPSEVAVRALVDVHEPLYRSFARRFAPSVMRRSERMGLLLVTAAALAAAVLPVLRSGLPRDPSPFLLPIVALLAGLLALAGRKAMQLWVEKDHELRRLRSGMTTLLVGSCLAIGCAVVGFVFELYRLMLGVEVGSPESIGPLLVGWILDTSVLVGAGLVTALAGGLCWFLLLQKVEAVERAYQHEGSFTGAPCATSTSYDHPLAPKGALR